MEGGDGTDASVCFSVFDWTRTDPQVSGGLPGEVRMLRLRAKSSLRAASTAVMSVFTSSRSTMSPTRVELMLTLADWPLTLAGGGGGRRLKPLWEQKRRKASRSSLTFSLLGGVEPDAGGAGEGGGLLEPGGHGGGSSDLSHQQGAQQVQPIESHNRPEGGQKCGF